MATFTTGWISHSNVWSLRVVIEETNRSAANNTTGLNCSLQMMYKLSYGSEVNTDGDYYYTVAGYDFHIGYTHASEWCENGTIITLTSDYLEVTHDIDGSKTITVSMEASITGQGIFNKVSRDITLTPFNRNNTI